MPLMHGKSSNAFEHNMKAEMHAGKPQKQALAIAYAVKRHAAKKKMAEGGQVDPSQTLGAAINYPGSDKKVVARKYMAEGGMVENEDLHPEYEPEHSAKDKVYGQYALSHKEESHGQLPHPEEGNFEVEPDEEDQPAHMMAHGGLAKAVFMKHGGKYAEGGEVEEPHPDDDFLSDEEQTPYFHPNDMEDFKEKPSRKEFLGRIMRGLHSRHYGT